MKRLILVFVAGLGLFACNDNTNALGTGDSIDSNYSAPNSSGSSDHTRIQPDTTVIDSSYGETSDNNIEKDNPAGTSSGQSGSATGSNNSGSVKDDTGDNK